MDNVESTDTSSQKKDSKGEKIVYKRRSSVFQCREVPFDECEDTRHSGDEIEKEENFDLQKYIDNLREERRLWRETLKQRKAERSNLIAQKSSLESQGQDLDLRVLSDDETAFAKARPNYEQICKDYKKLTDAAFKVAMLNQRFCALSDKLTSTMERNLDRATKKVIRMSES